MCTLQHSGRRQLVDEIAQFDGKLGERLWGPSRCRRLRKGAGSLRRYVCQHSRAICVWGSWQWALAWTACWAPMHGACMLCSSRTPAGQCMLCNAPCIAYNAAYKMHNALGLHAAWYQGCHSSTIIPKRKFIRQRLHKFLRKMQPGLCSVLLHVA